MFAYPDSYCREFINFAVNHNSGYVLEIAGAYGLISYIVSKLGGKIILNDMSKEHLDIFYSNIQENEKRNVIIKQGKFPDEVELSDSCLNAVLIANLFHFFRLEEIIIALEKVYKWLKPGGKVFITATSEKHGYTKFLPKDKRDKMNIPGEGVFENAGDFLKNNIPYNRPQFHHWISPQTMEYVINKAGFYLEKTSYISWKGVFGEVGDPWIDDGREAVGAICSKKN